MKRLARVKCEWTPAFAYSIGIIATDGSLSSSGRHISITSKDVDLLEDLKEIWGITNKIGMKARGGSTLKNYGVLQFGDVSFYEFLTSIGLTPAKSKTLGAISIPTRLFPHFLRGCIDGDGCISSYEHPASSRLQLKVSVCSASPAFLTWLHTNIRKQFDISGGWITRADKRSTFSLAFGKRDSVRILKKIYRAKGKHYLARKYAKAKKYLNE